MTAGVLNAVKAAGRLELWLQRGGGLTTDRANPGTEWLRRNRGKTASDFTTDEHR